MFRMKIKMELSLLMSWVDVKDHPYQESMISENEKLRILIIDISKIVAFKKTKFFKISKASALKFVDPNFLSALIHSISVSVSTTSRTEKNSVHPSSG